MFKLIGICIMVKFNYRPKHVDEVGQHLTVVFNRAHRHSMTRAQHEQAITAFLRDHNISYDRIVCVQDRTLPTYSVLGSTVNWMVWSELTV